MVDDAGGCEGRCRRPYPCSSGPNVRPANMQTCNDETLPRRRVRHPLGRSMHEGKSAAKRERDLSGRHFCLLCTLCPFVGNQDSGGKKSYYVSQYAHKRERNRATCLRRNTLNKGPLCKAIFSFSGQNHCQGTFVPQWLVHVLRPLILLRSSVRLNGLAMRTAQC